MKNIRVSRFVNWCEHKSSIKKVLVVSNNEKSSEYIIYKLKEIKDVEYINFNNANGLFKIGKIEYDTVILGCGWYFNDIIAKHIKDIILNKKVFEIDLDDLVSNDIEYNKENKIEFKLELNQKSINKVNEDLDNIKNKILSIVDLSKCNKINIPEELYYQPKKCILNINDLKEGKISIEGFSEPEFLYSDGDIISINFTKEMKC